jgi:hypothetical protein
MASLPALRSLRALQSCYADYGPDRSVRKRSLLRILGKARLPDAAAVRSYHEILCFLRAVPDDPALLREVEAQLSGFAARPDLRRHARSLRDSGIAGTDIHYPFFEGMARWIVDRWPDRVEVDWAAMTPAQEEELGNRLGFLALPTESPGLDELDLGTRAWVDHLRGVEPDAAFLVRRFRSLRLPDGIQETFYEDLDLPLVLHAGPDTPSRTRARHAGSPRVYQDRPLRRERPDLRTEALREPLLVRVAGRAEARRYLDLAREAMITRFRDLDAFAFGSVDDVRVLDWEDGLQFVAVGMIPGRRLVFEAVTGYLTLRNGVPTGYVLNSALFGSAEIAYNVFETWRGHEAAFVYSRVLATVRHLFGADSFTIYPYQLGDHNEEGLRSGAWWFYQKLGFRPKDPATLRLMERELARMRRRPGHRSPIATLRLLARENVYLHLGPAREDVMGLLPLAAASLAVSRAIGARFGADRERARRVLAAETAERLGGGPDATWSRHEKEAWHRWAPILSVLPDLDGWTRSERAAALEVVRRKGGRHESDFVRAFDAHARLRASLLALGRGAESLLEAGPSARPGRSRES